MEFTEKLANLIMIQYYLTMDLEIHDTDFSLKEVEIGQKALDENGGSEKALENALDAYIKENDWTGYLGTFGSGNRERGFAVEGFFEACGRDLRYNELTERALEIGNGKVYAVQDAFYTRKTHDATGEKDIMIKNGDRDPGLTNTEKDVAKKSIEVLKQMGKLGDISKEYNVDHGPDLTYIPVEDTVKVTPDNGSKPYKIKIPEALSFLKSYEYDILDEAVAVYTKVDECKKALQESFSAIETVSPADNKNFGYLENEVTIFKVK